MQPDGKSFETYTTRNGLPSDVVSPSRRPAGPALAEHEQRPQSAFDPRTGQFANYGVTDGLQAASSTSAPGPEHERRASSAASTASTPSCPTAPPRRPGARRSCSRRSASDHRPLAAPQTRRAIRLGFRDKVLGLEFAALDSPRPTATFAYKLEGFDPEWVPLSGAELPTRT